MKKVLTTCPYCGTGCGFYLVTDDENKRVIAVEGAVNHPVNEGRLCIKGWNAFQFVNHPDRLTAPLIRKNGKLMPASWEEALTLVATKLKEVAAQHGKDSLMFSISSRTTNEDIYVLQKLARVAFKTNNVDNCARLCHGPTVIGLAETFGSGAMTNSIACIDSTQCFLVIGSNTTEAHPIIGAKIIKAARAGAKLIVVDSRAVRLTRHATHHIRLRNGTDIAFLNGLMHVIIQEGLENKEFIAQRTENFAALKELVAAYTPEKVAAICGITPDEIRAIARLYATTHPSMIIYCLGITEHTCGVNNVKNVANLAMLTGNVGATGTGVNPLRGQNNVQGSCDMGALPYVLPGYQKLDNPGVIAKFEKAWRTASLPTKKGYTTTVAYDLAVAGKVKAFYIMGADPINCDADRSNIEKALSSLDFLVVQDIFLTPTCEYAHVVLPGTSYAEKDGTFANTERRIQRVRKAIDPVGSSKADWQIVCELARHLGCGESFNYNHPGEIMDEIAALIPHFGGIGYDRIEEVGLQWPCPTREHPGTPILHTETFSRGLGHFSPVHHTDPAELTDAEYPLLLSTGRAYFHYHGGAMTRRARLLEREEHVPYVEISTQDAAQLKIKNDDLVVVETRRGTLKVTARIVDIKPGVIFMTFHFAEAPTNVLTINARDPVAETPEFKVCAARVKKAVS